MQVELKGTIFLKAIDAGFGEKLKHIQSNLYMFF